MRTAVLVGLVLLIGLMLANTIGTAARKFDDYQRVPVVAVGPCTADGNGQLSYALNGKQYTYTGRCRQPAPDVLFVLPTWPETAYTAEEREQERADIPNAILPGMIIGVLVMATFSFAQSRAAALKKISPRTGPLAHK